MPQEDEPGFDPFGEPDHYREEHPAHEVKTLAQLVGPLDAPPAEAAPPPPMQIRCAQCNKAYTAKPIWFQGKWRYGRICLDCTDGNRLPTDYAYKRPPNRQLSCPWCGVRRGVDPVLLQNLWYYTLTCANCGQTALAIHRIRRTCDSCQKEYIVDDQRPNRECLTCRENKQVFKR